MSFMPRPSRRSLFALAGLGAGAAVLAGCGDDGSGGGGGGGGMSVVTSNYPLHFLVARIGGARVEVTDLAKPGADAHGLELSVRQVMEVQEAALVLQIPGYQAALDDAIASAKDGNVLDISQVISMLPTGNHTDEDEASDDGGEHEHDEEGAPSHEGYDHGPNDPHFWHDPLRMADVADAIATRLAELDPDATESFSTGAQEVRTVLEDLDAELTERYGTVDGERTFITSHAAYAYLADRYGLQQVGIAGVDPETEPSPQRLLALERVIADEDVTTIFFETTASPKVAQTLAQNVGVQSDELDNLETQLSADADYPAVMRENSRKLIASWS